MGVVKSERSLPHCPTSQDRVQTEHEQGNLRVSLSLNLSNLLRCALPCISPAVIFLCKTERRPKAFLFC